MRARPLGRARANERACLMSLKPEYANVPPGEHTSADGTNLVIAATYGDLPMIHEICKHYESDDPDSQRFLALMGTIAALAALTLRSLHPDDRDHFINHMRGIAKRKYIADKAGIDGEADVMNYVGLY